MEEKDLRPALLRTVDAHPKVFLWPEVTKDIINESPIVVRKDLGNLIEIGNFGCDLKTKTFHYGGRMSYHEGRFVLNERSEWTGEIIGFTGQ